MVTTFNTTADLLAELEDQDAAANSVVSHISPERCNRSFRNDS